ncbi:dipeptidase [Ferruginivarius sediminum]|uniref:Dipeptidase n=1 Tax=Ferruginivarius sediminum TaxID=2661937 RepID=A0A369T9B2_9PROT|nr:dipeptidase [Ferruginivarius sediminum]RDD61880.1 dipeptidase [Ferruginivarius sediminum]
MSDLDAILARIDSDFDSAVKRWSDFLRIPSVSTDPAFNDKTREAAEWVKGQLAELGFDASVRDTDGHPMVVGHYPGPGETDPGGDVPHVLYYGHYDVQPPDPLDEWDSGPFEPSIVEGPRGRRMVARGAVDDKGQVMTFLEAFRAWKAVHGSLPIRITAFFEGEEECGSPSLIPFLKANSQELGADVCVVSDTGSWDLETPAITTRLRGLLYTELTVRGPSHDLHSGLYGGAVPNPLNALTKVLGGLHDEHGRVAIPGFYDDVVEPEAETRRQWDALSADEQAFLAGVGLDTPSGEAGRSLLEKVWSRPTCDINGAIGGYTGAGAKTVIPAKASAKISFRLVPEQDPRRLAEAFRAFIAERMPAGCTWELTVDKGSPAFCVPTDSPYLQAAMDALEDVYGRKAVLIGSGGSIPVVGMFHDILGVDTLLMGFGLDDDRMHSPNEKFELKCLENGMKSHAALLERLRTMGRARKAAE